MKKLKVKRLLYVVGLIVAHAAAISGGVLLRGQTAYAQIEPVPKWGTRTTIDNLPACDCTRPQPHECSCVVE